jgi:hypothetical protein
MYAAKKCKYCRAQTSYSTANIWRKLNYSNHKQVPVLTMALDRARLSDDEHNVAGKKKKTRMA